MQKERFTMEELTSLLREKNIFSIADVEFAILETDGKLSVLPKSEKQPLKPSDLNIPTPYQGLTKDIIIDGNIMEENLIDTQRDKTWLIQQLSLYNVKDIKEVFMRA